MCVPDMKELNTFVCAVQGNNSSKYSRSTLGSP